MSDKQNITLRINSPGGDVFAAHAIYTQLKTHPANITAIVDGLAASAATIPLMAANTTKIPSNAMVMVHNPMLVLWGLYNAGELGKMAETLNSIKDSMINAYISKTGLDKKTLSKMMDAETWMTGEEAVEKGFADELLFQNIQASMSGNMLVVNSISHDLSRFKNVPQTLFKTGGSTGFNKLPKQEPAPTPQPVNKKEDDGTVEIKTVDELRQNFPDLVAQVEAAARQEGATSERQRIKAIDEISQTVAPELVNKAKYDEPMTAEKLAFEALKNDATKGRQYLENLTKDNGGSGVQNVGGQPQVQKTDEEKKAKAANTIAEFANKRRNK